MKFIKSLLLLSALFAAPVWAEDAAPSIPKMTQTAKVGNAVLGLLVKDAKAEGVKTNKDVKADGCPVGCTLAICPPPKGAFVCCSNGVPCF
jgi:hypothetical protein